MAGIDLIEEHPPPDTGRSSADPAVPARASGRLERPLRRHAEGALVAGVCGGLAGRFGLTPRSVRLAALAAVALGGIGALAYVVLWLSVPRAGEPDPIVERVVRNRQELRAELAVVSAAIVSLVVLQAAGLRSMGPFAWSFVLAGVGVFAAWRSSSRDEREHLEELVGSRPRWGRGPGALCVRIALALSFLAAGITLLARIHRLAGSAASALLGTLAFAFGIFVLFAPWWLETFRELSNERKERVRAEERATVAAHLHDSVLQTLALIQKSAGDPREVAKLARNQERELRQWLFQPRPFERVSEGGGGFAAMLASIERDVEDRYGVEVELVVVGDCEATPAVVALVAAGREAVVNAAKWSGAATISVFAEVEADTASFFVRDLGAGFEPERVPADRKGISHSIRDRVERHGGSVHLRSAPGAGTEIELAVPRSG